MLGPSTRKAYDHAIKQLAALVVYHTLPPIEEQLLLEHLIITMARRVKQIKSRRDNGRDE